VNTTNERHRVDLSGGEAGYYCEKSARHDIRAKSVILGDWAWMLLSTASSPLCAQRSCGTIVAPQISRCNITLWYPS
jgi:hypothetical protein